MVKIGPPHLLQQLFQELFSQATYNVNLLVCALLLRRYSQAKRRNKRLFNYCQTSVHSLSMLDSLVDHRAYKPYTLMEPPVQPPVLAPLAVYSSTTDYL